MSRFRKCPGCGALLRVGELRLIIRFNAGAMNRGQWRRCSRCGHEDKAHRFTAQRERPVYVDDDDLEW